jgi:acetyl-CoA acyltransferase
MAKKPSPSNAAVIVDGLRSPFVKAFAEFQKWGTVELSQRVAGALLEKSNFPVDSLDEVIMGCVLPSVSAPNVAREIVLGLDLPKTIPGMTVARACSSSAQALILAAQGIRCGDYRAALVGGVESMSNVPVPYSKRVIDTLMALTKAKSLPKRLELLSRLRPADFLPRTPDIAEASTGKTMGQHAEAMARLNGITREEQDQFALTSQLRAAAAWESGRYAEEVCPLWPPPAFQPVTRDSYVRSDTSLDKLASLKPAFDRSYGTLTAANSSGLTDGAAMLIVCEEEHARKLGCQPLARVVAWSNSALAPEPQLLLGPAYAIPAVLKKANLGLQDIDLLDIHEAFAAQVLSVIRKLECPEFGKTLGWEGAIGRVDPEKLNVNGGSIALGHPFGATGARMVLSMARELQRRQGRYALLSLCAAGGLGTAILLERVSA